MKNALILSHLKNPELVLYDEGYRDEYHNNQHIDKETIALSLKFFTKTSKILNFKC